MLGLNSRCPDSEPVLISLHLAGEVQERCAQPRERPLLQVGPRVRPAQRGIKLPHRREKGFPKASPRSKGQSGATVQAPAWQHLPRLFHSPPPAPTQTSCSVPGGNLVCCPSLGYPWMLETGSAVSSIFLPATCAQPFQEPSAGNRQRILLVTLSKPFEIP